MAERSFEPSFGHGAGGPMYVHVPLADGRSTSPFNLSTSGHIEVSLHVLRELPPFDQPAVRHALKERLDAIPGVALSDDPVERGTWPSFDGGHLVAPEAFAQFVAVLEWISERLASGTLPQ